MTSSGDRRRQPAIPPFPRSLEEQQHLREFQHAFGSDGGRFNEQDDLLTWYRLRYWHYIKTFRNSPLHRPYLERFHFDLVANEYLNAAATQYKATHLIGLNVGTILNLEVFFSLLLSHPEVLPEIGQPSKEIPWIASLSACDWRLPWTSIVKKASLRAQPPESFPIDKVRNIYAHRLAILATDFVFFHELGHLANGHIEYLQAKGRGLGVKELIHAELSPQEALDRQALEFKADAHAAIVMTQDWFQNPERLPTNHAFGTITEAVESLALAVIAVFLLFDPHPTRIRDYSRAAHPHPAVRLVNVSLTAWHTAEQASPGAGERLDAARYRGLQRAEAMCAAANIASSVWSTIAVDMESVQAEYRRIATHFQTVDRSLRLDIPGRHK